MQTKSFTKATVASVLSLFLGNVGIAQNSNAQPHCKPISGTVMTNLGGNSDDERGRARSVRDP